MIVIAGAGLSGLSLGYYLQKAGVEYVIYEKEPKAGGCLRSLRLKDYLLEEGPNTLLCDSNLDDLIKELGLEQEVVFPASVNKKRYIYKDKNYQELPAGPRDLFLGKFFSWKTKFKIIQELLRKKGASRTTTLEDFFKEHFGQEVTDYALNPFISGIYAGLPSELLLDETFPLLREYEIKNGSVLKGIIKNAGSRKTTVNFKEGIQTLPLKMAENLNIQYDTTILKIEKSNNKFGIALSKAGIIEKVASDILVLCIPSYEMSAILFSLYPEFAKYLKAIRYPALSIVHSVYNKSDIDFELQGFGGLNPKVENKFSAGSIWTSSLFPERTKTNTVLFTTFVGGMQYQDQAKLGEIEIKKKVNEELRRDFNIRSNAEFQNFYYWHRSIPQYDGEMVKAKSFLSQYEKENFFVCSNVFGGISMPDCIKKGKALANRLSDFQ